MEEEGLQLPQSTLGSSPDSLAMSARGTTAHRVTIGTTIGPTRDVAYLDQEQSGENSLNCHLKDQCSRGSSLRNHQHSGSL